MEDPNFTPIQYPKRFNQEIDTQGIGPDSSGEQKPDVRFDGMSNGKMRWPTDVDAVYDLSTGECIGVTGAYDLHGKGFIFFEVKTDSAPTRRSQKLFFSNLIRMAKPDCFILAVIAQSYESDPKKPIILKDCKVREHCIGKKSEDGKSLIPVWEPGRKNATVYDYYQWFIKRVEEITGDRRTYL